MRRIQALTLLLSLLAALSMAADNQLSGERQTELIYLLRQDCGSCHGMRLSGGLGPSLLPGDLQGKPAAYLRHVIARGSPNSAMPPWEHILTPAEIDFIVYYLTQEQVALEHQP
jgi:cytochrome c55X